MWTFGACSFTDGACSGLFSGSTPYTFSYQKARECTPCCGLSYCYLRKAQAYECLL